VNDFLDKRVPDHIGFGEMAETDPGDIVQQ
jgi:hypothetical protein